MADKVDSLEIDLTDTADSTMETWFQELTIASVYGITAVPLSNNRARIIIFYANS